MISPATVDVLLQTVQNALPSRTQDVCSVTSVRELVLTCLTTLVHIIHSVQPEQVTAECGCQTNEADFI